MDTNVRSQLVCVEAFSHKNLLQLCGQLRRGCKSVKGILDIHKNDGKRGVFGFYNSGITAEKQRGKNSLLAFEASKLCFHAVLGCPW